MKKRENTIRKMQWQAWKLRQGVTLQNSFKAFLSLWGLRDHICHDYPAGTLQFNLEWVRAQPFPKPPVAMSYAASCTTQAGDVISEIQQRVDDVARRSVPTVGPDDWWKWYIPSLKAMELLTKLPRTAKAAPARVKDPQAVVDHQREELFKLLEDAERGIWRHVLAERSRVDAGLFSCRGNLLSRGALEVDYTPAQVRHVNVGGHTRRAYRSGVVEFLPPGAPYNVWNNWTASELPDGGEGIYPVYVQSHALHRLEQRFDFEECNALFHLYLGESLRRPVLFPGQRPQEYLVEYRMGEQRFGYLVAERLNDLVLVRTFKLLTMDGTPEGQRLRQTLGLHRADIDYNRLDRWSTFADSDLGMDAGLVQLFTECGCGQLFLPPELQEGAEPEMKVAQALREYIGMPPLPDVLATAWTGHSSAGDHQFSRTPG